MKTFIILASITAFSFGAEKVIIQPMKAIGNTCATVCDCAYGPCQYEQGTSAKACTINGKSTDCCAYCAQ